MSKLPQVQEGVIEQISASIQKEPLSFLLDNSDIIKEENPVLYRAMVIVTTNLDYAEAFQDIDDKLRENIVRHAVFSYILAYKSLKTQAEVDELEGG
jgi:hypothetical protein